MELSHIILFTIRTLLGVCVVLLIVPLGFGPSSQVPLVTVTDLGIGLYGGDPTIRFGIYGYCVSIEPSNGTGATCFDPKFGYDVTALQYNTPAGPIHFGIDPAFAEIGSHGAQLFSNAIGVLEPVTLTSDVLALICTFRHLRPITLMLVMVLAFCLTTSTASTVMVWVFGVKNSHWAVKGDSSASHPGSGTLGPAVYVVLIALFLQLIAVLLNAIYFCLQKRKQKPQDEADTGLDDVNDTMSFEMEPQDTWDATSQKRLISHHVGHSI